MPITFQSKVLAEPARAPGKWIGPRNVRVRVERKVVRREYIGAPRARQKDLGNSSGTLEFEATMVCATPEEAAALALDYEDTLPRGEGELSFGGKAYANAAIKAVECTQDGVSVHAALSIEFGEKT